jgi:hypothetical protein
LRSENEDVEAGGDDEESDIGLPRDASTLTKGSKKSAKSTLTHWADGTPKAYGDRNKKQKPKNAEV